MAIKEQVIKKSALSPTVLIAGGAGFIGSHLAQALLQRDARVIVLDNFKTGKDVYISSLVKNPKFAFFDADINQDISENIHSVDYIVHLAGVETYLYSRDEVSLDSLLTNAIGTKNLLDLAQKSEAKFLLVSSVDVYQGFLSPVDLEHYFGKTQEEERKYSLTEAKRFAEALVWEYYKNNQTDVRIVRLPEVYGPRMNLNSSGNLGRLLQSLLENKALDIYGEGTEKEYYLHVSDAISGLTKALFNNRTEGKIFTLAPEEPHAVLEIAYLLKSLADGEVQVSFKHKKEGEPVSTKIPDRGEIDILKWEPKVGFKSGIDNTLKWFGYESNVHTFKPSQLIAKKKEEKAKEKGMLISSLVDIKERLKGEETPAKPISIQKEKPEEKWVEQVGKPKKRLPFPKLHLPKIIKEKWSRLSQMEPQNKRALATTTAVGVALFVFIFMPFIQTSVNAKTGINKLQDVAEKLSQMEPDLAKDSANKAFQKFYKAQKSLRRSRWFFNLTGQQEFHTSFGALLSSATNFSRGTYYISKAAPPFTQIWEASKPNSDIQLDSEAFLEAEINLNEAKNSLQQALADYKRVNIDALSINLQTQTQKYEETLEGLITWVDTASVLATDIPNLFGANDELKRYLILFQNSHEIRPTGGFIGSYAVVEVQNGKIVTLTIDDVYNPDGQISVRDIKVDPPEPLGTLLNEDRAYIRNANWEPSFPESAKDIEDLYFRVTGKEVHGIAAIDLFFAENILRVTGPVFLTAFGEEITTNNLYERAQFHSEFNYENDSSQKRTFLTTFGGKLLEAIFALPNEKMPELITEVEKALEEKHLMGTLSNSTFNSELEKHGWDGSLKNIEGADYLYVVNANVGGTKANYYVQNQMEYTVTSQTRDGLLRGVLTLTYNHTGTDNAWPGGPYKDYVRVLTQEGSNLTGATLNTGEETKNIFEELVISKIDKYNTFETLLELQPQETAVLTFYYDLPQQLSITALNREYNLYWQKQPGTRGDTIILRFDPPFGLKANGHDQITTEAELTTDRAFSLTLQ